MKKTITLFSLFFISVTLHSQVTSLQFENIKQLIKEADPKANIDEKLILISFWSPNNNESRQLNKEVNRVANIYKNAKLRGGKNGMYFFNYCLSDDMMNYKMAVKRDSLNLNASLLQNNENKIIINSIDPNHSLQTILFTSTGEVLETNTKKEDVFALILKQITR
ncbi:MAG: hypothetical protein JNJ40_17875 [Bacteroidia bacterium]|nr:hypothetical protein [Bacteroidia bacterium]